MEYRRLGKSGLKVSALSFGSWLTFGKQISNNTAEKLMGYAYDNGINFFDNAEIYAQGKSEIVMGRIIKKMKWDRTSFVVSSKAFFGDHRKGPNQTGLSRKHLVEACNNALERLQVDYLDLYFCHRPDKETPIEEVVWTMNHLIQQGKILYWGTSEWSAQEIMEAHMAAKDYRLIGPTMEQPQYNMFERKKMEVEYSQIFKNIGMGTTTWSPLASGVLTDKYLRKNFPKGTRLGMDGLEWLKDAALQDERIPKVHALNEFAKELGISLPRMAVAWALKNPNVSTVILGASKLAQLKENLKALGDVSLLTPEVMDRVEDILANKPVAPMF